MSQYIHFSFRIVKDLIKVVQKTIELSIKATRYVQKTLNTWNQIENKKFWKCLNCGLKFDLAQSEQKEICIICRIGACLN